MKKISICIPAYKNVTYLTRLLESIQSQIYKDFEVIITDDSPNDNIEKLLQLSFSTLDVKYIKNERSLGSPANWNECIKYANGEWIKIMHDDDWFSGQNSLSMFYEAIVQHPDINFFFSAFRNVDDTSGIKKEVYCTFIDQMYLRFDVYNLLKKVYIGNPSCTLFKNNQNIYFDTDYKFVVDFDFYIQYLSSNKFKYIDSILINVGFNEDQITKYTFNVSKVQIPENISFLNKHGNLILRNIFVYDYYWRLFRNLRIRSIQDVLSYEGLVVSDQIIELLKFQIKIPLKILTYGIMSKFFMLYSYIMKLRLKL